MVMDTSYNYLKLAFNQDLAEFLCISATIALCKKINQHYNLQEMGRYSCFKQAAIPDSATIVSSSIVMNWTGMGG